MTGIGQAVGLLRPQGRQLLPAYDEFCQSPHLSGRLRARMGLDDLPEACQDFGVDGVRLGELADDLLRAVSLPLHLRVSFDSQDPQRLS